MTKKLLVTFVAALMAMPGTALAETPHYTSNGPNIGAEPVPWIAWGTVTIKAITGGVPGSFITCRIAAAGTVANPGGGNPATDKTPGEGVTQAFIGAVGTCEQEGIFPQTEKSGLLAEKLPWANKLEIAGGSIRQAITGVKILLTGTFKEKIESTVKFVTNPASVCCKSLHPNFRKGTSALHPGFLEFSIPQSGELESEGPPPEGFLEEGIRVGLEGELKVLGYNEQELINVKIDPA